ncbi:Rpn family recombination-promoting nuclease/putative transposase [Bacillus piscicola]|uniref:Rpn family recombination-promoting nuclease/putative transposase n=1 Tax=Bacillus piscicola TaxID=1632684 RepID=UPI001F09BDE2|nr:Rpn family recombination-promoting nuclease/putative transposase [Bacillus piscicola]
MKSKVLKRIPLERLMDLKVDYAFKQLFGSEKNKEITVVFLNAVLQRTGKDSIKDITFSNTEAGGEYETDKQSRLDLLVVTNADEWINVEIQFTDQYNMTKRSIYYWSGVYRSQMKRKMGYRELRPVIAINLLNFDMFQQTEQFHTIFHLYEDEERFKLTDIMEFHFIEMPKLIQDWKAEKLNPWNDVLARWLLLLGIVDHRNGKVYEDIFKELEEISMKDEKLRNVFHNWEILSCTQEEMLAYEARLKRVLDEEAAVREAELRIQEAETRAKEAEAQGEKRGEKRGEERTKEKTARRLLAKGMEVKDIAEITELDEKRIMEIEQERKED